MAWHSTWSRMRGVKTDRQWMTWAEFDDFLRRLVYPMSAYHVRQALKSDRPAKVAGVKQYEPKHAWLAAEYARGKGWSE